MKQGRSHVTAWWLAGLVVATFSNSLALTRAGLPSYFDFLNRGGAAGGGEEGPGGGEQPEGGVVPGGTGGGGAGTAAGGGGSEPRPKPPSGKADEFRRHVVNWSLRDDDWALYSPYFPGIPGRGDAPDQTAEELGFQRLEDDNFIVFHEGNEDLARQVLGALGEAIPRMLEVFGNFPFPKFYNGRKIPVYLPKDFNRFATLAMDWGVTAPSGIAGFMSDVWDAGMRMYPAAMFLNPESVAKDPDWLKKVVTHELAHHVFAVNLDYTKRLRHPAWVNEGLAEYAAKDLQRLREMPPPPIRESLVARTSPGSETSDYWIGLSAFLLLEKMRGLTTVRALVKDLYERPVSQAFRAAGIPLEEFEKTWQEQAPTFASGL